MRPKFQITLIFGLLFGLALAQPARTRAEEPVSRFLDGLRDRQLFDVALDYLDSLKDSPLVSPPMKVLLPYERPKTLIQSASIERDYDASEKRLDEAQKLIEAFIAANSQHPLLEVANAELGNLFQRRANVKVQRSKKNGSAVDKKKFVDDARALYDKAHGIFKQATARLSKKVEADTKKGFIDREKQPDAYRIREELRKSFLQAQIVGAAILEEKADTYTSGSAEHKKALESAADEYTTIYERYRTRMAGLLAQLYLGRTHKKLRSFKDALHYLGDLLDQPKNEALRPLKTEALQLALDCWLDDSQKKYAEAVQRGSEWVATMRPNERNTTDWMRLRLTLAKAHKLYSDHLKAKDPKDAQARRSLSEARGLVLALSKSGGPLAREANALLATLPGGAEVATGDKKDPVDFKEALKAGNEAIQELKTQEFVLEELPKRLEVENDPKEKAALQAQIKEAETKLSEGRAQAVRYFQMALTFSGPETSIEDVNLCRYFLAYLSLVESDWYNAAIMGDFVATRYGDSASARQCATIALSAYVQIYIENKGQDRTYESEKIISTCMMIADRWKGEKETEQAVERLIPFLLKDLRYDDAEKYLVHIRADNPARADAELRIGRALWQKARITRQDKEVAEEKGTLTADQAAAADSQFTAFKTRAAKLLSTGIGRVRSNPTINETLMLAVLAVSQIYIEDGKQTEALALVEDAKVGILPLVSKNHEATQRKGFHSETYRLALRGYIALLGQSETPSAIIKKAVVVMDGLKKSVSDDEKGQRQLVAIYYGLARDLEALIKASKSDAQRKVLSSGFERFVSEVGQGSKEFNVQQGVAETFMGMGKGFENGDEQTPDSLKYYQMASAAFQRILDRVGEEKDWIGKDSVTQVRWRQALAKRAVGEYGEAMKLFATILMDRNSMLDLQIEAAKTYQQWARTQKSGRAKDFYYTKATNGGFMDKKAGRNIVWGWDKLARVAFRDPQGRFVNTYLEARYNQFLCRYEYAVSQKTKERKDKHLNIGKKSINTLLKVHKGGLGGWRARYDDLYRKIQTGLGETPTGLPAENNGG